MDYAQALAYISSTGRFGVKLGLERTRALLEEVGSPEVGLRGALVAGTNGKGSTCAILRSILTAAGLRTGSMPKPHLQSYAERICVDGIPISEESFARVVDDIRPAVETVAARLGHPTEFEMLTAAALRHLRDVNVDAIVCEVGLGGRLDSTNVLDVGVKVITSIDLDHTQYLGPDLESIAAEKAGIIREGDMVVIGEMEPAPRGVINETARRVGARAIFAHDDVHYTAHDLGWEGSEVAVTTEVRTHSGLRVHLVGSHQSHNAALAVAAADMLTVRHGFEISSDAVAEGVAAAWWPGRLERVEVDGRHVVIDGAHNPAAVRRVVSEVARLTSEDDKVTLLFGAMDDKDHREMLDLLPRHWPAILTTVDDPRAADAADLLAESNAVGRTGDRADAVIADALPEALAATPPGGTLLVLGSLYLAGAVRGAIGLS